MLINWTFINPKAQSKNRTYITFSPMSQKFVKIKLKCLWHASNVWPYAQAQALPCSHKDMTLRLWASRTRYPTFLKLKSLTLAETHRQKLGSSLALNHWTSVAPFDSHIQPVIFILKTSTNPLFSLTPVTHLTPLHTLLHVGEISFGWGF